MEEIRIIRTKTPKEKPVDEKALGFGKIFTDHMFAMNYSPDKGWHDPRIEPYDKLQLDPATMVFHYGQAIFEGLKAYQSEKGRTVLFRPRNNFARMNVSAERLCIPKFDEELALRGLKELIKIEEDWIPKTRGTSLYIRPTIIATDPFLGVRPSDTYLFFIILSPVGAYYAEGLKPVNIYVEDFYVRAVLGGTGHVKTAGNYAASLLAGEKAKKEGFSQVLWLDACDKSHVGEVGAMNIFFKLKDELVTPPLDGTILGGVTRDSVIQVARQLGLTVNERPISIEEVYQAYEDGTLEEIFGSGTAAVISSVGLLHWKGHDMLINGGNMGEWTQKIYDTITGIQYEEKEDSFGWIETL